MTDSDSTAAETPRIPPPSKEVKKDEFYPFDAPITILDVLGDLYSRQILAVTSKSPKSVSDIHQECKIPLATLYRRMEYLEKNGLLWKRARRRADGKWFYEYYSRIKQIQIEFSAEGITLHLVLVEPIEDRFARIWKAIKKDL